MTRLRSGALVVAFALAGLDAFAENPASALLDQPAPSVRLTDVVSGEEISLEDLRGRIIVLHFAASW